MPALARPALDPHAAEMFRKAGRIAGNARKLGASMVRPGVLLRDVMEAVEDYIRSQDARPAFPAQTSRNHCAAHYCPSPKDTTRYEAEDVVKVDIGVEVDGYLADNAESIYLGEDPRYKRLIESSSAALQAAIDTAGPGVAVNEVSTVIESTIEEHGFRPVYNLTGHGLDRWKVHTAPQIPPSPDRYGSTVLEPGMVIAIEPFATSGRGSVHEQGRAEVFMISRKPRKLKGLDLDAWAVIEGLNGLPFARRTFPTSMDSAAIEGTLARLIRTGCLMVFPPLCDADSSVRIAQTEHTMIVTEDGVEVLTSGETPATS